MVYLWDIGYYFNKFFFHSEIISLRNLGLPLFLMQAALIFMLFKKFQNCISLIQWLGLSVIFSVFCDSYFIGYFNSLYPQGFSFLAVSVVFSGLLLATFTSGYSWKNSVGYCFICIFVMIFNAASKQQYFYFLPLALLFAIPVLWKITPTPHLRKRICIAAGIFYLSCAGLLFYNHFQKSSKIEHNLWGDETISFYKFSAHALYSGILPYMENPQQAIKELKLPEESEKFLGSDAGSPGFHEMLVWTKKVSVRHVIRAIIYDPLALAKLIWNNSASFGQVKDLPMIPEVNYGYPPIITAPFSSLSTLCAGHGLLGSILTIALILCCFPLGLSSEQFYFNRLSALFLAMVILCDLVLSVGDGCWNTEKHILCGSYSGLLLIAQLIFTILANWGRKNQNL